MTPLSYYSSNLLLIALETMRLLVQISFLDVWQGSEYTIDTHYATMYSMSNISFALQNNFCVS